jgi:hypothetical protein
MIDLLFDWFGLLCFANKNKNCQLSYSQFQTSQTGGQQYNDINDNDTNPGLALKKAWLKMMTRNNGNKCNSLGKNRLRKSTSFHPKILSV